ncbi:DUF192 domain-containing protein [Calderihabitans maritimus]|uniref:DUF192 domain-containing protein n=1 Tax=Calderihabitans maritimus TaxID=1246530 RepID=A0A1Z5HTH2_9FIRM|nr:DUF192 domain-containing protein [Calderihabitans maritimus]GAW92843.1 hypothetical protein Tph_c05530 [Calderihabitans maritimus]
MKLYNVTRRRMLAEDLTVANSFFKRLRGLMRYPNFPKHQGLLLVPCRSVHTCFMRFAIDVVFLNSSFRVVFAISQLKPYRFSPWIREAQMAVELEPGILVTTGTGIGDQLAIIGRERGMLNER